MAKTTPKRRTPRFHTGEVRDGLYAVSWDENLAYIHLSQLCSTPAMLAIIAILAADIGRD